MVKRCFNEWRAQQDPPIPYRCDNPDCTYHVSKLVWNGKELNLILDHIDGVHGNDNPKNLQYLCPNCNSQQSTHGGGNKDRVEQNEGGYAITEKGGSKNYHLPAEPGEIKITGGNAIFSKTTTPHKTK